MSCIGRNIIWMNAILIVSKNFSTFYYCVKCGPFILIFCNIKNKIEHCFSRWLRIIALICFDIISCTMYRIESVAIMCCNVGRVMKPGANSRASQSQSQSHVRPSHAPQLHINKPTVHFQPLTFIANDWSLNVSRLTTFLMEKRPYIMYFTDLSKVMKAVIYMLFIPSLFLPEKQVLTYKFESIYSSMCLWCMKRRVYSYRDRPLAGSLMGYGPQLHLFQWISLPGSARQHHVRACNREVMGR